MIRINDRKAQAAAEKLGLELGELTEEEVAVAYRYAAQSAHPDRGGTADEFTAIKEASDLLKKYLRQPKREVPLPECQTCLGKGFTTRRRGWNTARQTCPSCRGTGVIR